MLSVQTYWKFIDKTNRNWIELYLINLLWKVNFSSICSADDFFVAWQLIRRYRFWLGVFVFQTFILKIISFRGIASIKGDHIKRNFKYTHWSVLHFLNFLSLTIFGANDEKLIKPLTCKHSFVLLFSNSLKDVWCYENLFIYRRHFLLNEFWLTMKSLNSCYSICVKNLCRVSLRCM